MPAVAQNSSGLSATILGSGSPQYSEQRAGPSVLIKFGTTEIIVDTGNGAQARLNAANVPIRQLEGIFYTHHHLDHNEEFVPFFIQALLGGNPVLLAGPAPLRAMVESTLRLYKEDIDYRLGRRGRSMGDAQGGYRISELAGGEGFSVADIKITTAKVNHTIATVAYRFDAGGRSIVISGDLTYSASLSKLAKGADYLIIDSGGTIKVGQQARGQGRAQGGAAGGNGPGRRNGGAGQGGSGQSGGPGGQRAHVTLAETAQMAAEAGVKTLILTHFTTGQIDEAATKSELRKSFAGEILFASDLTKIGF